MLNLHGWKENQEDTSKKSASTNINSALNIF